MRHVARPAFQLQNLFKVSLTSLRRVTRAICGAGGAAALRVYCQPAQRCESSTEGSPKGHRRVTEGVDGTAAMRSFSEGGRRMRLNVVAHVSSQVAARFLIVVDEDAGIETLYAKAKA